MFVIPLKKCWCHRIVGWCPLQRCDSKGVVSSDGAVCCVWLCGVLAICSRQCCVCFSGISCFVFFAFYSKKSTGICAYFTGYRMIHIENKDPCVNPMPRHGCTMLWKLSAPCLYSNANLCRCMKTACLYPIFFSPFRCKIFGHKNDIMAIMVFLFEFFPAVKPNRKATNKKLQSLDSSYIMPHPPWMQHEVAKGLGMFKNRKRQHILIMPWTTVGASVADGWIRHQDKLSYWVSISGYDPCIGNAGHSKPNLNLAVGTRLAWVPCRFNRFFSARVSDTYCVFHKILVVLLVIHCLSMSHCCLFFNKLVTHTFIFFLRRRRTAWNVLYINKLLVVAFITCDGDVFNCDE